MKKITFYFVLAVGFALSTNVNAQAVDAVEGNLEITAPANQGTIETGTYYSGGAEGGLLYDNGPIITNNGSPNLSVLENVTFGLTTLGYGASSATGFSVADDVTFPNNVDISAVDFYAYQTGAPYPPTTLIGISLQVWDGDPSDPLSSVVWGDLTTNLYDIALYYDTIRQAEDNPGTTRGIGIITAATSGLLLDAGTYWFHWQFTGDGAYSGPWAPPVTILGQPETGNAKQQDGATTLWTDLRSGTAPNDFAQGMPFQVYGTEVLGVNENAISAMVSVTPNPAVNTITIANNSTTTLERAEIYNLQGKLVQQVNLQAVSTTVDISNFAAGIYMVHIYSAQGSFTKKLVKN